MTTRNLYKKAQDQMMVDAFRYGILTGFLLGQNFHEKTAAHRRLYKKAQGGAGTSGTGTGNIGPNNTGTSGAKDSFSPSEVLQRAHDVLVERGLPIGLVSGLTIGGLQWFLERLDDKNEEERGISRLLTKMVRGGILGSIAGLSYQVIAPYVWPPTTWSPVQTDAHAKAREQAIKQNVPRLTPGQDVGIRAAGTTAGGIWGLLRGLKKAPADAAKFTRVAKGAKGATLGGLTAYLVSKILTHLINRM